MANEESEDLSLELEAGAAAESPEGAKKPRDLSSLKKLGGLIVAAVLLSVVNFFIFNKLRPVVPPAATPPVGATVSSDADKKPEPKEEKKKKKRVTEEKSEGGEGKEGGAAPVDPDAPAYLEIQPAFVVNFKTQPFVRGPKYLQVSVVLMSHDRDALKDAEENMPLLKNALIGLFSSKTLDQLSSVEAREALRKEAVDLVKSKLKDANLADNIEDVLFASFVMQ